MKIIGWTLGVILFLFSLVFFIKGALISGFLLVVAGSLLVPTTRQKVSVEVEKLTKQKVTFASALGASVILFFAAVYFSVKPAQASKGLTVFSVTDFDYTMNDKPAVSISFGETQNDFCDLTLYRGVVFAGYASSSQQRSSKDFSVSCDWGGKHYVRSSKHPTSVKFEFLSYEADIKSAQVRVTLKLVEPMSGAFFELNNAEFVIRGQHFVNLTK